MFWVSSCSPLRYLCLCGWCFCTFSSPWHQGLFWVIASSLSLTDCTAPVTHSFWTCTLEFTVLNNWSKLYVFHIQLEEEITPLNSIYQAASVRKTFSMLEMFTAPQAEIINGRLQSSCVSMSTPWRFTNCWCSSVSFFGCLVAIVCLLVGKPEVVKGHIQCTVTLRPSSCYQRWGPLQKSHQCHRQDVGRALFSVNPSVISSAVDACDSFNLCLSFLLLLLLHTGTFPFMLHSYQS